MTNSSNQPQPQATLSELQPLPKSQPQNQPQIATSKLQSQSPSQPQPQPLLQQFKSYLEAPKTHLAKTANITSQTTANNPLSPSSVKNYVSDINHFLNWLTLALKTKTIQPIHITHENITNYQASLQKTIPPATINRKNTSLRRFGEFLKTTKLLPANPTQTLQNNPLRPSLNQVLNKFIIHLKSEKLTPSTIKNYVSDVKNYLLWTQKNSKSTGRNPELRS